MFDRCTHEFSEQHWKFLYCKLIFFRHRHRRCFIKDDVPKNFAKFKGKHLCQGLFFNEVAGLEAWNFIKDETLAQMLSFEFCEMFKNTFITEDLRTTASDFSYTAFFKQCLFRWRDVDHVIKTRKREKCK